MNEFTAKDVTLLDLLSKIVFLERRIKILEEKISVLEDNTK